MWGTHCCKSKKEDETKEEIEGLNGKPLKEFIEGCNGKSLSLNSICCESGEYKKCKSEEGCKDKRGKANFWLRWIEQVRMKF